MPRKQSDKIITHRVEFSPKERELVNDIIKTQKENQRLDAVTSTLNAVGVAIGGSGALVAGLALAAWFGFSVKDKVKEFYDKSADIGSEILTGRSVEENIQMIFEEQGISKQDFDNLKNRMIDLYAQKTRYCDSNSQYYDPVECQRVDAEMAQVRQQRQAMEAQLMKNIDPDAEGGIVWGIKQFNNRYNPLSFL
tara:strand:+ start:154 stop:735 length:582 start_codon:yes stop_codon:yes gene_type:complete